MADALSGPFRYTQMCSEPLPTSLSALTESLSGAS